MTKAERIFLKTRSDCKQHIQDWGYQVNPDGSAIGFNSVSCRDDEFICIRTLNAMEKLLEDSRKHNERANSRGIIDATKYAANVQLYNMIETTIRNARKALCDLNN